MSNIYRPFNNVWNIEFIIFIIRNLKIIGSFTRCLWWQPVMIKYIRYRILGKDLVLLHCFSCKTKCFLFFVFSLWFWTFRLHFGSPKFSFLVNCWRQFRWNHVLAFLLLNNTMWVSFTVFTFFWTFSFTSYFSTFSLVRLVSNSSFFLFFNHF